MSIEEQITELRGTALEEPSFGRILEEAADTIESLSKLQAEDCGGGWILCKERLPENSTEIVLVCLKNGAVSVAICPIGGEFINMIVGASVQKIRVFPECNPVIAWKPLPDPYHEP